MRDALLKLVEPGHFLYQTSPLSLTKNYLGLDHPDLELGLLRTEDVSSSAFVLPNYSPLRKMFDKGKTCI